MQNINKVLVFGATGAQGSPVVRRLLEADLAVKTATRQLEEAQRVFGDKVESAAVDLLNASSLREAFEGVDAAFLLVPVAVGADSAAAFTNALTAAREANLKRLVFTTGGPAYDALPPIPMVAALRGMTDAVLSCGIPSVVLRPTFYLENLLMPHVFAEIIERGTLSYPPLSAARRVSWTAQEDQASFAVAALTAESVVGKAFDIASPQPVTGDELAALLSDKLNRRINYAPLTPAEFGAGLSQAYGTEVGEMIAGLYEATDKLPDDGAVIDLKPVTSALSVKLTTVGEWIDSQNWGG